MIFKDILGKFKQNKIDINDEYIKHLNSYLELLSPLTKEEILEEQTTINCSRLPIEEKLAKIHTYWHWLQFLYHPKSNSACLCTFYQSGVL